MGQHLRIRHAEQLAPRDRNEFPMDDGDHDGPVSNKRRHDRSVSEARDSGFIVRGLSRPDRKDRRPKTKFKAVYLDSDA